MPRRKVSNPLALAVLACLAERPMHPYEMSTTMRERGKHESIKLNYGSLYSVVESLQKHGLTVATGGTDNHIVLADVAASYGLTGRQAESALRTVGMTLNRNSLPFDVNGPWYTSGLRLGTNVGVIPTFGTLEFRVCDVPTRVE